MEIALKIHVGRYTSATTQAAAPPHLPDERAAVVRLSAVLVRVGFLVPLDPVHHELAVLLLRLGATLHHDDVHVLVGYHAAAHVQLLGVRLHLEALRRVGQVLHPEQGNIKSTLIDVN